MYRKKMNSLISDSNTDETEFVFDDALTDRDFMLEKFIASYKEEEERRRDVRDYWEASNNRTVVKLPAIKCSKYTVIGDPSMEKRRRTRQVRDDVPMWSLAESQTSVYPGKGMAAAPQSGEGSSVGSTKSVRSQPLTLRAVLRRKRVSKKRTLDEPIKVMDAQLGENTATPTPKLQERKPRNRRQHGEAHGGDSTEITSNRQRILRSPLKTSSAGPCIEGQPVQGARSPRSVHSTEREKYFDSGQFKRLYMHITQPKTTSLPGPLECSPRFQDMHLEVEPQLLREKMLVLGDYFKTSHMQRYRQDRAVIPAGYPEAFRSKTFARHYVTALYIDDNQRKLERANTGPNCIRREYSKCHFCDVIGNRYCKSCIESKNRWFAANIERTPASSGKQRTGPL